MSLAPVPAQLEEQGYVVVPGFLDRSLTAAARDHIDRLAPPAEPAHLPDARRIYDLRHPLPGAIMAQLITAPLIELALAALQVSDLARLRLLEQVLIRTDPKPPPYGPGGWHIDWAFFPEEYTAAPKQTYFHFVHACSRVDPGGGAFMIVPGSHKQTYAATAAFRTEAELDAFKRDPAALAGVDLADACEVCVQEGDLIVFNPMALHSASGNASVVPRYVYFASFFDVSAQRLRDHLKRTNYIKGFPKELREGLPEAWRSLPAW